MSFERITESSSRYDHLEKMTTRELLENINREDATVSEAVKASIPSIEMLVNAILPRMQGGGRLFYIGAGTSGRLGIVDASECPPTFGVPHGLVNGLIAGGDQAIRRAVEFAEDDPNQAWKDLGEHLIDGKDSVIGLAASGSTPYVTGGLTSCNEHGILTGCITCNPGSPVTLIARYPVAVITGPEFVTGSTRMKAGTAQKMVLNMISTSVMIRLGRIKDNKMVDMQLTNAKLVDRGAKMLVNALGVSYEVAHRELLKYGSVRKAMESFTKR